MGDQSGTRSLIPSDSFTSGSDQRLRVAPAPCVRNYSEALALKIFCIFFQGVARSSASIANIVDSLDAFMGAELRKSSLRGVKRRVAASWSLRVAGARISASARTATAAEIQPCLRTSDRI